MIYLTNADVADLWGECHPRKFTQCGGVICDKCEIVVVCEALRLAANSMYRSPEIASLLLRTAAANYADYTDKVCDTYTCPACPDYSWCTTLRGIAIEGVKLE